MTFGKRKAGTQKRQAFVKLHSFSKGQDVSFQFCYIFNSSKIGFPQKLWKNARGKPSNFMLSSRRVPAFGSWVSFDENLRIGVVHVSHEKRAPGWLG